MNLEFFQRLYRDPDFCRQLGQMTLAAGRFESNLRAYLLLRGVAVTEREATLGALTQKLQASGCISENGVQVLRSLKRQRNYLTHSLFDLFTARVEETLLPRSELLPSDVVMFTEAAWQLEQNLIGLDEIVDGQIESLLRLEPAARQDAGLLFSP